MFIMFFLYYVYSCFYRRRNYLSSTNCDFYGTFQTYFFQFLDYMSPGYFSYMSMNLTNSLMLLECFGLLF
jgi:hypothetical protein